MCYKNEDMNKCNIIDIYYTLYRFMAENQHQEHTSSNLASSGFKKKIDVKKKEFLWGFEGSDV